MRGVVCGDSAGKVETRNDLPEPSLADGEAILRPKLAGICDTDLQLAKGYMGFRGILGHEFVAEDERGRRVTAEINNACHRCPVCLSGMTNHCPNRSVMGILGRDGAMADQVLVPIRNLHLIPDEIADEEAVFIEPLAAAFRIAEQVPLDVSTRLAVLGDGKLGLLCAWATRLSGARVTLIGKHTEKLALAGPDIATSLLEDAPRGFDVVVDATGSPTGLATALSLVRPCGAVVLKTTIAAQHQVQLAPIVIDEVRIIGSRCGPFPRAIDALARRGIDVRPLIEAEFPLDRAPEAFQAAARQGARKILLRIRHS